MIKNSFTNISQSLEDYLENIYILEKKNLNVRVTDIANSLNISKPSVTKAVKILVSKNLVIHENYKKIYLTEEGKKIAKNVLKRHTLIKTFLVRILNIEDSTAEKEACTMEHAISYNTMEKFSDFLIKLLHEKEKYEN